MTTYAEVNAQGIVTNFVENNGDYYAPADGSYLLQTNAFKVGQRYEPVAGNHPLAFTFLGTPPAAKTKKSTLDGDQA